MPRSSPLVRLQTNPKRRTACLLHAAQRLAGGVCGEPVVGENRVWRAVVQAAWRKQVQRWHGASYTARYTILRLSKSLLKPKPPKQNSQDMLPMPSLAEQLASAQPNNHLTAQLAHLCWNRLTLTPATSVSSWCSAANSRSTCLVTDGGGWPAGGR